MATVNFIRVAKNGWYTFRIPGVPGSLYIDGRMVTAEAKESGVYPTTLELDFPLVAPGADASEKARLAAEKKAAADLAKTEKALKAAEKANAKLAKLQETAAKAQAIVDAAKAKVAAAMGTEPVAE